MTLSRLQHLGIIKALANDVGGGFMLKGDREVSYKKELGQWVNSVDADAFACEKFFVRRIGDIAVEHDLHGGASIVKDARASYSFFSRIKTDGFLLQDRVDTIEHEAIQVGARINGRFSDVLRGALNSSRIPSQVMSVLVGMGAQLTWDKHHVGALAPLIPESDLVRNNFGLELRDVGVLIGEMKRSAETSGGVPELFFMEFHGSIFRQNFAVTFKGAPGTLGSPPGAMHRYFRDVLIGYSRIGDEAIESGLRGLSFIHKPFGLDSRTIEPGQEIARLRLKMKEHKSISAAPALSRVIDAGELNGNRMEKVGVFAYQQTLDDWREVLQKIKTRMPSAPIGKMDHMWDVIVSEINENTSQSDMESIVRQVGTTFGRFVMNYSDSVLSGVRGKVSEKCKNHPQLSVELESVISKALQLDSSGIIGMAKVAFTIEIAIDDKAISECICRVEANPIDIPLFSRHGGLYFAESSKDGVGSNGVSVAPSV
jgi:hypothetical protein